MTLYRARTSSRAEESEGVFGRQSRIVSASRAP